MTITIMSKHVEPIHTCHWTYKNWTFLFIPSDVHPRASCSPVHFSISYQVFCWFLGVLQVQKKDIRVLLDHKPSNAINQTSVSYSHILPTCYATVHILRRHGERLPNWPSVILIARRGCLTGTRPRWDNPEVTELDHHWRNETEWTLNGNRFCYLSIWFYNIWFCMHLFEEDYIVV